MKQYKVMCSYLKMTLFNQKQHDIISSERYLDKQKFISSISENLTRLGSKSFLVIIKVENMYTIMMNKGKTRIILNKSINKIYFDV